MLLTVCYIHQLHTNERRPGHSNVHVESQKWCSLYFELALRLTTDKQQPVYRKRRAPRPMSSAPENSSSYTYQPAYHRKVLLRVSGPRGVGGSCYAWLGTAWLATRLPVYDCFRTVTSAKQIHL